MEYWDIYDKNKQLTGRTMKKNDWILKEGEYHLSVIAILQRNDGKYLITQRVMSKSWAPGWWEVPGGACMAGETSREAIVREVKEETGLDVSHAQGGLVFTYHRENIEEGDNYFVDVYKFILDFDESDIQIQKEEALSYKICTKEELEPLKDIFLHYYSIEKAF
ncbi:MAG: NUDIX domain-containing protein [Floccifex sp.]